MFNFKFYTPVLYLELETQERASRVEERRKFLVHYFCTQFGPFHLIHQDAKAVDEDTELFTLTYACAGSSFDFFTF